MIREHIWTFKSLYYLKMPIHKVLKDGLINVIIFDDDRKISIKSTIEKYPTYTICDVPVAKIIQKGAMPTELFYKTSLNEESVREWLKALNGNPKEEDINHFNKLLETYNSKQTMLPTGKEIV